MMVLLAMVLGASAQTVETPDLNAQLYRTPVDARLTMWADDSSWAPGSYAMGRVVVNYMNDPLQYTYSDGEVVGVLTDVLQANAVLGFSFGRVRVGVDVPFTLAALSDTSAGGAGLGDVAIDIKGNALDRGKWGTGLAFGVRGNVPTNTVDAALGENGPNVELQAIVDRRLGNAFVAGNVGSRVTAFDGERNTQWAARPFARVGTGYLFSNELGVSFDMAGYASQKFQLGAPSGAPVEYLVGGWYRANENLVFRGGIGRGLTRAVGASRARVTLSVGFEPPRESDADLDGIMDRIDECPFEAEDRDLFEDDDGCPDVDNDGDTIIDDFDACTLTPEDVDGFEDSDGCPEFATEAHLRVNGADGKAITSAKITVTGAGITPRWGGGDYRVVLDPGSYTMSVVADGYKPYEATVLIVEGESYERIASLDLADPKGQLSLSVIGGHGREIHGAMVASDGGQFEPISGLLELNSGPYRKHIRAPGFGTTELIVRIRAGEVVNESIVLPDSRAISNEQGIALSESITFAVNGSELDDGSHRVLDDLAGVLLDAEVLAVTLTGYADVAGAEEEQRALGAKRAKAAKDWLVSRGVEGSRVLIAGGTTGDEVPEASIVVTHTGGTE